MEGNFESRRFCRKCLLKEYDEDEYKRNLEDYINMIGQKERTGEAEYERRLQICLSCEKLDRGTCQACGCYVELRAAGRNAHCPKKKW